MPSPQPDWQKIIVAFNVLACLSIVFIILVLLPPLLFKSVHRRKPWYSHMLAWLVLAIALLLLIGHQQDRTPPAELCFIQSALLYATPPLIAFSMTCYLLDINLAMNALLNRQSVRRRKLETSIILAIFPWVVFWGVIIEVSVIFASEKELESSDDEPDGPHVRLFCHHNNPIANISTTVLVTIAAIILILVKGWMIVLLLRKFRSYEWSTVRISQMVLSAFIRTVAFSIVALIGIAVGLLSCTLKAGDPVWGLVLPVLPIFAALMYGVHADVIRCLMFWREVGEPAIPEDDERPPTPPPKGDERTPVTCLRNPLECTRESPERP